MGLSVVFLFFLLSMEEELYSQNLLNIEEVKLNENKQEEDGSPKSNFTHVELAVFGPPPHLKRVVILDSGKVLAQH